jgi:hypothetical protein
MLPALQGFLHDLIIPASVAAVAAAPLPVTPASLADKAKRDHACAAQQHLRPTATPRRAVVRRCADVRKAMDNVSRAPTPIVVGLRKPTTIDACEAATVPVPSQVRSGMRATGTKLSPDACCTARAGKPSPGFFTTHTAFRNMQALQHI